MPQHHYEIRVRGRLGTTLRTAFPGLRARVQDNHTVLSGPLADRAALHGVLTTIETLGLELIELRQVTNPELISRMVRAGELEISGEDQAEVGTYFDQENFRFHGPGGFETDYAGLTAYFASLRAAFDNRKITRGNIVAEGNTVACQTWIEGTFTHEFTQSPAGPLPPNGARIVMDLISIFRFDNNGRLIEEFVRTDYRSLLHQLGAEAHPQSLYGGR
jgi:predicted ester cyclase